MNYYMNLNLHHYLVKINDKIFINELLFLDRNIIKMSMSSNKDHHDTDFGQDSSGTAVFTSNQILLLIVIILAIIFLNLIIASVVLYRYVVCGLICGKNSVWEGSINFRM